jgi:hypothetical protein
MTKTKTFVDANILMAAFQGKDDLSQKALQILDDPERQFIASDYLKLEVIPKPKFYRRDEEVQFMEAFFESASLHVRSTPLITAQAIDLACRYDLHPLDALHAGTAIESKADEFITLEKRTKPICQIREIVVKSLNPEDK